MDTIRLNPDEVWNDPKFPFSQAVVEPSGRRVHLTGQVAWTVDYDVVGKNDPERQTHCAIDNIERILSHLGGDLSDVMSLTTYYVRDEDLSAIYEARRRRFPLEHGPAVTGIKVAGLVDARLLVELTVVAVIPDHKFRPGAAVADDRP